MKTDINHPAASKINYTAGIQSIFNVAVYLGVSAGYIPQEAVVDVLVIGNIASAALINVFRTWFTKP